MKEACVPLSERKPNEVDELEEEIRKIQETCEHDFRLLAPVDLKESKVKGVFILLDESANLPPKTFVNSLYLLVKCLKCSQEERRFILNYCPRCLSRWQGGLALRRREIYFGKMHLSYEAILYYCDDCGFKGVADEWDQ